MQFTSYDDALKFCHQIGKDYSDIIDVAGTYTVRLPSKTPKPIFEWSYSVRSRYGNRTEYIEGPKKFYTMNRSRTEAKRYIKEKVKQIATNHEPYNVTLLGEI